MKNRVLRVISATLPVWLLMSSISSVCADDIPRIRPEELKKLIDSKADVLVVDNQPKSAYEINHITGAINFPWAMEITGPVDLPRDRLLVLYCACSHEEDSGHVGEQLMKKWKYNNIKLLEGGLLRWLKLGFPIERGGGK